MIIEWLTQGMIHSKLFFHTAVNKQHSVSLHQSLQQYMVLLDSIAIGIETISIYVLQSLKMIICNDGYDASVFVTYHIYMYKAIVKVHCTADFNHLLLSCEFPEGTSANQTKQKCVKTKNMCPVVNSSVPVQCLYLPPCHKQM